MSVRARAALLVASAAVAVAMSACETRQYHPFGAYPYDAKGDCLEAAVSVDVLDGPDPGKCPDLRCWEGPDGAVWVTDAACDAPLDFTEHTSDTAGPCAAALAAYARENHGRCGTEGGLADAGADGGA